MKGAIADRKLFDLYACMQCGSLVNSGALGVHGS